MIWNVFFVFTCSLWVVNSMEGYYYPRASSAAWGYFTPPLVKKVPFTAQPTAMEEMVELTNNLGVAILQDHTFSRGNFAFSPYGVASVLVVLYEGARGESAKQIQRAVKFPLDKHLIRVGFRDIHRHLRDYFSHEGYLSGINLNKESSTLKLEYKKILHLYGYDVDLNLSLDDKDDVGSGNKISEASSTVTENNKTKVSPSQTVVTKGPSMSHLIGDADKNPHESGIHTNSKTEFSTISAMLPFSPEKIRFPLQSTETVFQHLVETTTLTAEDFSQNSTELPGETETETEAEAEKTDKPFVNETDTIKTTTEILPMAKPQDGTSMLVTETVKNDKFQINITVGNGFDCTEKELPCNNDAETTTATEMTSVSEETATESEEKTTQSELEEITNTSLDNGMLIPQPDGRETTTENDSIGTKLQLATEETTETPFQRSTESFQLEDGFMGKRRSELKLPEDLNTNNVEMIKDLINSRASLWLGKKSKKRKIRTMTEHPKPLQNLDLGLQLKNGMYDNHMSRNAELYRKLPRLPFLVDGAIDTPVPMMMYTNVFPYAYVPRLHAKALEFPLDDVRYKLLILLPIERRGLRQLIYDLADFPLSNVLKNLRNSRVKAIVPTFMVEGFVILTSSLQKLGIWDVFDPRKANLSGMSTDPELYVRNVEQSVTVVIRNYVEILDIQTRTMAARQMDYEFEVTHPFLYFVMDTATNVVLMAGQILDPLNSRIY